MKVFNLPDLGEGLPDAEIVEWLVAEGDEVKTDQPMVNMETAKAVVEVPSPFTGKIAKLHGAAGDVIDTGAPLVSFLVEGEEEGERSEGVEAGDDVSTADAAAEPAADEAAAEEPRADSGTVVGAMESSDAVVTDAYSDVGGIKVTPAVRALARKLKVDLATVTPTGKDGVVTRKDIEDASRNPQASASQPSRVTRHPSPPPQRPATPPAPRPEATGEWEPIRGTRRTMARVMSESHAKVVATTLMDDADIHAWAWGQDTSVRLLRSLWAGAQAEPGLNAWYDGEQGMRMIHKGMDVGMAVDTPDGLFAAALRNIHSSTAGEVRESLNRLKDNVQNRAIPPEDLKDYTIMLSNFGVFAGRYATPIINPPCVCIVAAGKSRHEVVPVLGGVEAHKIIPLSLTFDHRAVTGGEAARFLKAMIEDLQKPE
ncbi:2-oxo acid dehydrogenase subunit E2 [Marinihelvus fidelis]|uniref:Dihydrolipoamide acetyltransferase component of pyruvate dehydrogenase complex n=1 Tax=Marinihelvus fidelis TaxID=2613842 RepID=A0A5N0T3T1_9GAMM|nr:dihydrolipoamide acetyltransferase family protein [Marinihelvus fidelis]KAA9129613.1 2-oxo acid dehydrogenase subunit E2 [Marinihelvus fidelis]